MNNMYLGGGDWFYDSDTGAGQKGISGGIGLNNIGALIRTWGNFTYVDETSFSIDDGSRIGVICQVPDTVTINPAWEYVVVTGISSCYKDGDDLRKLVLVRDQNDIIGF